MSEIKEVFQGSKVLVTGATGFLGQVLIEKLLRTCNNLETIYLLVRPKKGKNEQERFNELFDGHLFELLQRTNPNFKEKVHLIPGDFLMPGLGLTNDDRDHLKQNVNIIFHIAATVRFDQHISTAFTINVLGTQHLLEIASESKNFKAFIHISTAYSNCPHKDIDECFYDPILKWTEVRDLVNSLDDETLSAITPQIIEKWPNTYSFTKCLAEDLIRDLGKDLPVAIVRPSIVVSTANEPIKCWVNNFYGAGGVAAGAGMGLIRVMRANESNNMDIVPVDFVMNSAIAAAWDVATNKPTEAVILNYVSSTQRPITFGEFMHNLTSSSWTPALICIWYYFLILQKQRHLYNFLTIILHTIPAIIADTVSVTLGKKPRLIKGYQKVHKFIDVSAYFAVQEWRFNNNNVQALWEKLNDQDKTLFHFDISTLDWELFLHHLLRGLRLYTFHESFDTLDAAKAHYSRLKILHYTVIYSVLLLLIWTVHQLLKNYYIRIMQI